MAGTKYPHEQEESTYETSGVADSKMIISPLQSLPQRPRGTVISEYEMNVSPMRQFPPLEALFPSEMTKDLMRIEDIKPLETLPFEIHSWSSYSAAYHPKNITVDRPTDQSSRWSSGNNNQMQFITLKLEKPCLVKTITFGKYHKVHVCNLKEFKVFGGLTTDHIVELLHSGLRNDDEPETFQLRYKTDEILFPCQYIKIVPLQAWGANFNYSIWYVQLRGVSDLDIIQRAQLEYKNYCEHQAMRLCLKHIRQNRLMDLFASLQSRTGSQLEHPLLAELHSVLVSQGDFDAAESILNRASEIGMFDDYLSSCDYKAVWCRILSKDSKEYVPCMRGGHQMCIDSDFGHIYLFGGWDGTKDLCDLWRYSIASNTWVCLTNDTKK
jgi:hypothetical protein